MKAFHFLYGKTGVNFVVGLWSWLTFTSHRGHYFARSSHQIHEIPMKWLQIDRNNDNTDQVWPKTFSLWYTKTNVNFKQIFGLGWLSLPTGGII
jgi:hypothetical protein